MSRGEGEMCWDLVSIIGPPASGKTTLAERLAEALPAELVREDYAGNPFLADSYVGSPSMRLCGQLYFLMSRVRQLARGAFRRGALAVSDYAFRQDAVYAELRLDAADLAVYRVIASRVGDMVQPPRLIVHLDAGEDALLARIAARGRAYETAMTRRFLAEMRGVYAGVCAKATCPVVTIDTESTDLRDEACRGRVVQMVREQL
jgi:deoxyadenosine/deoxycytidine kinase